MSDEPSRKGTQLYRRAKQLIPGGTQLLSKRPEMFLPDGWPSYFSRAKGAETWDLDGNRYVDMSHFGVGTCVLGFADDDVNLAVMDAVNNGSMSTLNCPEEVELAELILDLHGWADMVRFSRCGGEAMTIAVRIARAATGRDEIAFCGYHGWHDWYLAANLPAPDALDDHLLAGLDPAGVPQALAGTAHPFAFNDLDGLTDLIDRCGDRLAAIVVEPARSEVASDEFLSELRSQATRLGAVLVFDEITSGWRMNTGGIHLTLGAVPDIAVFAKAMGNGYPMAAVVGIESVLETAQQSFISSTNWTERVGPAAALATIEKHRELNVPDHLIDVGNTVQGIWRAAAEAAGLSLETTGIPPLSHFRIDDPQWNVIATIFTQEMLGKGFLASPQLYSSYAHQAQHLDAYAAAVAQVFDLIGSSRREGNLDNILRGPTRHSGFQRLT